jgi:rubrerythrin
MDSRAAAWREAVLLAQRAEDEAARFYAHAAENTRDPRGRDMFRQLAEFEQAHYRHLQRLLDTSPGSGFPGYSGTTFSDVPPGLPSAGLNHHEVKTDLEALDLAIKAEKAANAAYLDLAGKSAEIVVREMFLKLAEEENLHRKVLEDQYYALTNRGVWVWGD